MKKRLRLEVTTEDIRAGVRMDPASCPLARAMCRAGLTMPSVVIWYAYGTTPDGRRRLYAMSKRAKAFMHRFDLNRQSVKPAVFLLPEVGT